VLEFGQDNVVYLIKTKHYIEVSMIVLCLPGWIFGMCVPFFSIVVLQVLKLKYTTNYYTRDAFDRFCGYLEDYMPGILFSWSVGILKSWVGQ
jgi:hypothetical protein